MAEPSVFFNQSLTIVLFTVPSASEIRYTVSSFPTSLDAPDFKSSMMFPMLSSTSLSAVSSVASSVDSVDSSTVSPAGTFAALTR